MEAAELLSKVAALEQQLALSEAQSAEAEQEAAIRQTAAHARRQLSTAEQQLAAAQLKLTAARDHHAAHVRSMSDLTSHAQNQTATLAGYKEELRGLAQGADHRAAIIKAAEEQLQALRTQLHANSNEGNPQTILKSLIYFIDTFLKLTRVRRKSPPRTYPFKSSLATLTCSRVPLNFTRRALCRLRRCAFFLFPQLLTNAYLKGVHFHVKEKQIRGKAVVSL